MLNAQLSCGPITKAVCLHESTVMNDTASVTLIAHNDYILLHLLENRLGQQLRTHQTVVARREIIYFRGGPFTPK